MRSVGAGPETEAHLATPATNVEVSWAPDEPEIRRPDDHVLHAAEEESRGHGAAIQLPSHAGFSLPPHPLRTKVGIELRLRRPSRKSRSASTGGVTALPIAAVMPRAATLPAGIEACTHVGRSLPRPDVEPNGGGKGPDCAGSPVERRIRLARPRARTTRLAHAIPAESISPSLDPKPCLSTPPARLAAFDRNPPSIVPPMPCVYPS